MPAARVEPHLRHDGIFYDDEFDFVAAAIPFIREGVESGETVMVNTGNNPVTPLLRAMFDDDDRVVIAERPVYTTPAAALEGYRRTMEQGLARGARGYRAIGFIDFETSPLPWQEWLRYEAAVNRVFADLPFRTLCPYDTSKVSSSITAPIMGAHPGLVGKDGWRRNEQYVDPAELVLREDLRTPPHALQATTPRMVFEPPRDLMELRMEVYAATMFTDLPREKLDDFVKAVGEVVANAHEHGRPPVLAQVWASDAAVVCAVTDQGEGIADPLAGYARPRHPSERLGLWAVRQLCDILDFGLTSDGFTVRVVSLG